MLRLLHELAPKHPQAFGHLLQAIDFHLSPVKEVALVGDDVGSLERVVRGAFGRIWCWREARPTACRCCRIARRWTVVRRPTCASTSPAGRR